MPEEPGLADVIAEQRELLAGLRAVVEAKDAENAVLRAELGAERGLRRRLELRVAELERRLGMDSSNSGTPSSKEQIGGRSAARRSGRSGIPRSGSAAGTAGAAASPATRVRACPVIPVRMSRRPRIPRRSARGAGPPWTARGWRARRGRRPGTCGSPGS